MDLVNRIKKLCEQNGTSIPKLGDELGLGKTIYRWNVNYPSIDKVVAVADFLGVPIQQLLGRDNFFEKETAVVAAAEPTIEQLEIAELAKPLARYLEENMIIGEVIVSMNTVALRWEGFTARYGSDFETIEPPR
ncbi:hypothetical protein J40TS1_00020 [Paenibacillus montaniterrae]|uniref:HTH cro/C1-type domain-containing protein n=1 Tax=Paenibacillus montaniterrae TaxID=429341 RepID=A0A920CVP6_9BACL|nr:helix-turn-helix transcriptional regulator [Paenibacillus montaniterrae]GIP14360.1 hypothetical protein J40TS1_00020 [Paenibacillus montaniterrae]